MAAKRKREPKQQSTSTGRRVPWHVRHDDRQPLNGGAPSDVAPIERWDHGERVVAEPAPGSRIRVERAGSGIDALLANGTIDNRLANAASLWQRDYEGALCVGQGAAPASDRVRVDTSVTATDGGIVRRLDAATRYREACAAIGLLGDALLQLTVAAGLSLSRLEAVLTPSTGAAGALPPELQAVAARVRRLNRVALVGALVATLDRLADHYDAVDREHAAAARTRRAAAGRGDAA
ncbi:conserved protein of unknown function (plasmid) [Rhodovastum atsumiense]|uniref:Uncharacterized protein n=1 Tax=Rhodovastum atsumiense TaxID=504468 RepID=A0A5M6IVG8_9PROT|nr:hypothetical protein [Rhodovastum atsumiense]KAA5611837.1 hypothetical protein F1189_12430 [Rhodovastum atsumiense]CAH2606193.1 conserved protein of unknown function [Rhodovastum atsumiense]